MDIRKIDKNFSSAPVDVANIVSNPRAIESTRRNENSFFKEMTSFGEFPLVIYL